MGLIRPAIKSADDINLILDEYRKQMNARIAKKVMEMKEEEYRDKQAEKKLCL